MLLSAQIAELKGQLAAAHAEIDAGAAKVADAASVHSQIDWLHNRLQSSMEEIQVPFFCFESSPSHPSCKPCLALEVGEIQVPLWVSPLFVFCRQHARPVRQLQHVVAAGNTLYLCTCCTYSEMHPPCCRWVTRPCSRRWRRARSRSPRRKVHTLVPS